MLNTPNKLKFATALFLAFATYAMSSNAETGRGGPGGQGGPQGGPPQEAIQACASLTEGTACSFTGRQGETMTGSCITPPRGEASLICAPEGGNARPPRPEKSAE